MAESWLRASFRFHSRTAGALGGKLTGAGGGGFMLLFVPPENQGAVRKQLDSLVHVPFKFDFSGSQIIVCDHEEDYGELETTTNPPQDRVFREWNRNDALNQDSAMNEEPRAKIA
jgi:D-glycero-alpha-D-manno-heptose-7-phosphate kinase